jgi:hypothetical protein
MSPNGDIWRALCQASWTGAGESVTFRPMRRTVLSIALAAGAFASHAAFKCVDPKGVSHYEDVPPAACASVTIYEVSASGTVLRRIEPQKAAPPPEPRKAETDRATLDRERRDRTLLDTFATEREIDVARDRSLDLIKARIASVEGQLNLVRKRRKQVESAADARKAGPGAGKSPLESVQAEEAALEHTLAGYHAEMQRVQQQFETDKVRWRELKARSASR